MLSWRSIWHVIWHLSDIFSDIDFDILRPFIWHTFWHFIGGRILDMFWHFYVELCCILSEFYVLIFDQTYVLIFHVAVYLASYLTWFLTFDLTSTLSFYLTYCLTFLSDIHSDIPRWHFIWFYQTYFLTYVLTISDSFQFDLTCIYIIYIYNYVSLHSFRQEFLEPIRAWSFFCGSVQATASS